MNSVSIVVWCEVRLLDRLMRQYLKLQQTYCYLKKCLWCGASHTLRSVLLMMSCNWIAAKMDPPLGDDFSS